MSDDLFEDYSGSDAMQAAEAFQPRPYPKKCGVCGGTGRIYVKVNGVDAVRDCECRQRKIEQQEFSRKLRKRRQK